MNEHIKVLAYQAGFVFWEGEEWAPGDLIDWGSRYDAELAKFAELIVQECASRCVYISDRLAVLELSSTN